MTSELEQKIESAKEKLKKYNSEFSIVIVGGLGASIQHNEIRIGKDNPLEIIEPMVIHEAYHIIYGIDQTEAFKEKDKGNPTPYFESEMFIWNKIKTNFPKLSNAVDLAVKLEKKLLGI